jgi:hypothetical protein
MADIFHEYLFRIKQYNKYTKTWCYVEKYVENMSKKTVGLVENVEVIGEKSIKAYALFDTGATRTSIDTKLAGEAKLGPIMSIIRIKQASTKSEVRRPVVRAMIKIKGETFEVKVNIQDREHMSFPIIIGRDVLAENFLVDAEKNKNLFQKKKRKEQPNLMRYV